MRIRKNAKASAFLQTLPSNNNININNNNNNIQQTTTLCLLNQSPWDIISFPSTPSSTTSIHLFDDYVTCYDVVNAAAAAAHWSSPDSTTPNHSVASTKNAYEWEYDIINKNVDDKIRDYEAYKEDKLGFMKGCVEKEDINVVDIQNDTVWSTNKKAQPVGRKKRAVAVTPKQNEFYYYSGFGPSWGKKRGCTTFNACHTTSSSHVYDGDMDMDEGEKRAESDTTTSAVMRTVWSCQVAPGKGDFDYMGEYEEHCNGKQEKTLKKKGRKPMKARSLKSLM